jgi:hypothetical protein
MGAGARQMIAGALGTKPRTLPRSSVDAHASRPPGDASELSRLPAAIA